MTDCPRTGKLFGGCKFSPRYDEVTAPEPFVSMMEAFFYTPRPPPPSTPNRKTYICDVCERCGKTLFRRKQPEAKAP